MSPTAVTTIRIPATPQGHYEVRVGAGNLTDVLRDVTQWLPHTRPFVVTDAHVHRAGYTKQLLGDAEVPVFVIEPAGEASKTLATVAAIVGDMEERRYGRDSLLLALGGGTVGDIGGFAAAIFKRGIPCIQIPTTTVAQADSAIGGKTGVDSPLSKNAFGAFHHPARVYVDCRTLRTLDDRNYRAGLVESVKHGMIADAEYFDYIAEHTPALLQRDETVLAHMAARNAAIKGRVVFEDPTEKNLRRVLNFGHTVGHAVESAGGYSLLHGEAVAIGIIAACGIAEALGICGPEAGRRARALLESLGQPVAIPAGIPEDAIADAMRRDKKAVAQSPRFVLLDDIGSVHAPDGAWAVEVAPDVVDSTVRALRAR